MSQVSAPVSTTVIAGDIAGAASFGAAVLDAFEQVVTVARALGFVTREPGRPNLTLTLAPDQDTGVALDGLAKAAISFDEAAKPLRLRCVAHFGVVFRTESPEGVSYVGSAIRSTQSALRRAPQAGGLMATTEYAAFAAKQGRLPFQVQPISPVSVEGLNALVFGDAAATSPVPGANAGPAQGAGVDAGFVEYARRRLAEEIGPFANALIDRAIRSASTPKEVAALLVRDIDNPDARRKFEDDLLRFAKTRT